MPVAAGIVGDADRPAGAAALNMAAEFGRPAQLDRAHHTPLEASERTVMNLPIRLAVAAEDIRHLQSRRHGAASSDGRHHLDVQLVERALCAPNEAVRDLGVPRRARQVVVAEQHLDDADVGSALQQMRGEGVPERVHRHPLVDASGGTRRAAGRIDRRSLPRTG